MTYAEGAQVGEIATALGRLAPQELATLRSKHPDQAVLFEPGGVMGEGPTAVPPACDLALALLSRFIGSSSQLLRRMRRRLGASWWFDLVAKLAATGGAGGTIAAFLGQLSMGAGTAAGLVALAGSACGLVFSLMQRDAAGGSLIASYNKLVEAMVDADQEERALRLLCPQGSSKDLDAALDKVNELARVLNDLNLRYG